MLLDVWKGASALKNRTIVFVFAAVAVLTLPACDAGSLIALVSPTATPTRTPRPTFTPRPASSPTPEESPTPAPTATLAASPTPTQRAAATARPATKPPAPTPVPGPQFPVTLNEGYFCEQAQSPIWKITGRINRSTEPRIFLGGYVLGLFAADGRFLKASVPSAYDGNQTHTIGGNCRVEKWYLSNLEIDVTEFRGQLPLIVRIIKSKLDPAPLSKDFRMDFTTPGHYFVEYTAAQ
jgi:hypothetical protein